MNKISDETLLRTVEAVREHKTQREASATLGIVQSTISNHLRQAKKRGLIHDKGGSVEVFETKKAELPPKGKKRVYYVTCAQDRTKLHADAWRNLLALVEHDDAKLLVSTFKYNKDAQGQRGAAKWESREAELAASYPSEIVPHVCDDRIDLTANLTFCGELNVLPTAVNPLEGLESYTYRKSTIVPHPKLALQSVATMPGEGVKLMYTTGCVTQRNYIKRKVGYKAEHFHSYGALVVEIDDQGRWYCRQVVHGPDGRMYDLDRCAHKGKVTTGHRAADLTWGDVHAGKLDPVVAEVSWVRKDSILDTLRPHTQHVHDLLDFSARSHHTRKDPHQVYESFVNGKWELTQELHLTAGVLFNQIARKWCQTFVVNSNHDRHLERWLKEQDWRLDPANAVMILALNHTILSAIRAGKKINIAEHAIRLALDGEVAPNPVCFLAEDESHVILPDVDGGIECGLHADRGANGSKGTISGIAKMDRKVNGADKHTTAIMNHAYFAGTSGLLDMGFNKGPSSWTHGHVLTYPNSTRAIISIWKGKWRA